MRFEKIVYDRCKAESGFPEGRKLWVSGIGREGGLDLCNDCYNSLIHWFEKYSDTPQAESEMEE